MMRPTRRDVLRAATIATTTAFLPRPAAATDNGLRAIAMISGSAEYHSDETLPAFAAQLEKAYRVKCDFIAGKDGAGDPLPGIERIAAADLVLVFTRRLRPPTEQLEVFKRYCASGKPIVGVRTASHAFQDWLAFDKEVLGGNYQNHCPAGPTMSVAVVERAKDHPILVGVARSFTSSSSLYKNPSVDDAGGDIEVLLTGSIPGHTEPVAWTHARKGTASGGRVFYTSLGSPSDFQDANFNRLLTNGLIWALDVPPDELRR